MTELQKLEQSGNYLFHGSETPNIIEFEPRQSYTERDGKRIEDDKPGVHVTPFVKVAVFMAIINKANCPKGFYSTFFMEDGVIHLQATQEGMDQILDSKNNPKGYVYVFGKDKFQKRNELEYISYEGVKPEFCIEVDRQVLSEIEIIKDPLKE